MIDDPLPPLQSSLARVPDRPGVYKFKDDSGRILYVGVAESLRSRVRSYFQDSALHTPKIQRMVERAWDVEWVVAESVVQALIWESDLVKHEQPPYNTKLKDDKHFLYVRIDLQERWPRPALVRRMAADGGRYFGPFPSATKLRETLRALRWVFPWCDDPAKGAETRPCNNYRYFPERLCPGACAATIDESGYRLIMAGLVRFFEGRLPHVLEALEREMQEAAERLLFERAGDLRDRLNAARDVVSAQSQIYSTRVDEDIVGLARDGDQASAQILHIRHGRLVRESGFSLEGSRGDSDAELAAAFVKQFYAQAAEVPEAILLSSELDNAASIRDWLRQLRGSGVELLVPRRGRRRQMVRVASDNAEAALRRAQDELLTGGTRLQGALASLQEQLGLPRLPSRIECYDISNIQGTNPVGSMVVFERGQPRRSDYKRFQIKTVEGADDFGMMREVLSRRLKRALAATEGLGAARADGQTSEVDNRESRASGWTRLPDLIVVDGGKGQLNAAMETLRELGAEQIPIVGLAKEEEVLFVPEERFRQARQFGIFLPRGSPELFLVQRVRDEAHRFAVTYHRSLRGRRGLGSALDEIPGIGPKRKRALLRRFGSLKGIREATEDDLARAPGMNARSAQALRAGLGLTVSAPVPPASFQQTVDGLAAG